ncbi:hypothetical protein A2U01_0012859 [Trifolium medium]|uniref:Uncharacterized protein n=1 Tax=Trifolium medium TaxID=97028 RepID=A0A392MZ05_9FABA|nr:hypothetical protein [Trifolium medium]
MVTAELIRGGEGMGFRRRWCVALYGRRSYAVVSSEGGIGGARAERVSEESVFKS